jgi:hypothetical protein
MRNHWPLIRDGDDVPELAERRNPGAAHSRRSDPG